MSNQLAAEAAFQKARDIYRGGAKSSNKLHLPAKSPFAKSQMLDFDFGLDVEDDEYIDRHLEAFKLVDQERNQKYTYKHEGDAFDRGRILRLTRSRAQNCNELALIAAEWAHRTLGAPRPAPIALVNLTAPADHIFCVVGPRDKLQALAGKTVGRLLSDVAEGDDLWAVDPWLNVFCNVTNYGQLAEARCQKWQVAGKRVAWCSGPFGPGWYSPQGAYSYRFLKSGLEVNLL